MFNIALIIYNDKLMMKDVFENRKIKLLSLDLDGTTLKSDNTLSKKVKSAIEKAIKSGIEVVAASGRPFGSMHKDILEIDGLNYVIASNGAVICDRRGKVFHTSLLKESDVLTLLKITEPYDLIFEAFIGGLTYTDRRYTDNPMKYGCSEAYVDYVKASHGHIEDMRKFILDNRKRLDSVEYVCNDKNLREKVRRLIEKSTHGMYITSSSEHFVEFMDKAATKACALSWVCNNIGLKMTNVAACGNADNDADMIDIAGLGAAVKNASSLCIKNADIVVDSNDNDGVAELIDILIGHNSEI